MSFIESLGVLVALLIGAVLLVSWYNLLARQLRSRDEAGRIIEAGDRATYELWSAAQRVLNQRSLK